MFNLGLIINPCAGLGGSLGLKGSDGLAMAAAIEQGAVPRAQERCARVLERLSAYKDQLLVSTYPGLMGESCAKAADLPVKTLGEINSTTTAADTERAVKDLQASDIDLLLFVGGDGTARNIFDALDVSASSHFPVLGIPSGVKMHSGVYAVSPEAAAELVVLLLEGKLVDLGEAEVRDIDEQAFRRGVVKARHYGELWVPQQGGFLQHVKVGGREVEELVLDDIAADVIEEMDAKTLYIIGPGTTTAAIMEALSLSNTLLGIDVVRNECLIASDVNEEELLALLDKHAGSAKIIVTAIGGQGHILGRGNQQISSRVIERVGTDNLIIVATKSKITELSGRPLLVDSNDPVLDQKLKGFRKVITGYHDAILYPVGLNIDE